MEGICYALGATIWWILKGRKTLWEDELYRHKARNLGTGIAVLLVLILFGSISSWGDEHAKDLADHCWAGEVNACRQVLENHSSKLDHAQVLSLANRGCKLGEKWSCSFYILNGKTRQYPFWEASKKLRDKVITRLDPVLLTEAQAVNRFYGSNEIIRSSQSSLQYLRAVQRSLARIENSYYPALKDDLIAVVLVQGLHSSAYSFDVIDEKENSKGWVILLDSQNSGKILSAWLKWREGTSSRTQTFSVSVEPKREDTIENTVTYILLHEIGHVVGSNRGVIPPIHGVPAKSDSEKYPFLLHSWNVQDDGYTPKLKHLRNKFRHYLPVAERETHSANDYAMIQSAGFVSSYATSHPQEDFAESFATYALTSSSISEVSIAVRDQSLKLLSFWSLPANRGKRNALREIFGSLKSERGSK